VGKTEMKDMVVLLPGIMGSVLQKDGKDIWNISTEAIWRGTCEVVSRRSLFEELTLQEDDPEKYYLDDGIRATGLIQDARLLPGFFKVDGYSYIRTQIIKDFNITPGKVDEDKRANFFEFPYDWRRDNRVAARLLKKLIDQKLSRWQEIHPGAKVILIAHSMGGIVARYYLEHLGGAEHCKALITLGTPYRGSVKILNYLANGFRKRPLPELTEVVRSFTSAYQLLPMYPMVNVDGNWQRVAEADGIPGVVKERAEQGREFLLSLKGTGAYQTKPIVGVGQSTFQSATFANGKLEVSKDALPTNPNSQQALSPSYATGDDTVPLLSAIPLELSDQLQDVPLIECHGSLQCNPQVWTLVRTALMRLQDTISDFQNPKSIQSLSQPAGIRLDIDDLYLPDEPVQLRAEIVNVESETLNSTGNFGGLNAIITPVRLSEEQEEVETELKQEGDSLYVLTLDPTVLAPGLYRLTVETAKSHAQAPTSVRDLFQVMG
jgi:pimeloyl-ACP methyl ester carboxylesterase